MQSTQPGRTIASSCLVRCVFHPHSTCNAIFLHYTYHSTYQTPQRPALYLKFISACRSKPQRPIIRCSFPRCALPIPQLPIGSVHDHSSYTYHVICYAYACYAVLCVHAWGANSGVASGAAFSCHGFHSGYPYRYVRQRILCSLCWHTT